MIGRSAPIVEGSAEDAGGTPVGSSGAMVADSAFSLTANGFDGGSGTREVHTQIIDFDLGRGTGQLGPHVRAGLSAQNAPRIVGEVEVKAGRTGSLKSMHLFLREKGRDFGLRFNADVPSLIEAETSLADGMNRSFRLLSLPLYMVGQARRRCREAAGLTT